ncbi:MAG: TIGR00374 family protein [Chloroflexi bacterium]|nr:MAG: TIGR00374 family protein [Chloroflexota bacterium]
MKRKWIWLSLAIIISGIFVWLALRGLKLDEVWTYMVSANYVWLLPAVAVYFVAVWARTWRWDYMLRPLKQIPVRRLFPVVVIGYMGNNVYPFRAGEVLRSFVLYKREDISMSASLATVIVERVFDGLVMLIFVFIALPLSPIASENEYIRNVVILASAAFFVALIAFFALAAMPTRFRALATWGLGLTRSLLTDNNKSKILGILDNFLAGLESLRSFRNVLMIFFTSIIIWLLETVKYWFVMHAFDFEVSFFALMLMNGVVNLATTLPTAPGYVGTFDAPGIFVLELYGIPKEIAAAYTLVLHAALWFPITALGAYYMVQEGMRWADIGKAVEMKEEVKVTTVGH